MSMEDKVAQVEKLIAEVKAELAEKASKARNWPEKIEAGMRKEDAENGDLFRSYGRIVLIPPSYPNTYAIALTGESVGCQCYGWGDDPKLEYLGHARDILTIRTDAHEATGAELVGKRVMCWCTDAGGAWIGPYKCTEYNPFSTHEYKVESKEGTGYFHKVKLPR